jgi:aerobic-type carbon monoxide dehydrogenase small subunit (CoxS/CutS family)
MPRPTSLNIFLNGAPKSVPVTDASEPLLYVLRNKLDQVGPKIGCGAEQCGVCTVLVNGRAVRSCCAEVQSIPGGADVRTLDGLADKGQGHGRPRRLHALQRAFIDEQAAQCGYCIAGMIMRAQALLDANPTPTDAEIRRHMAPNLCRCGTHVRILRAIRRVAQQATRSGSVAKSARTHAT